MDLYFFGVLDGQFLMSYSDYGKSKFLSYTLRWDYYQYIQAHPITKLPIATSILYGGKDNLQPFESLQSFTYKFKCRLTGSEQSEHHFMSSSDYGMVEQWLIESV